MRTHIYQEITSDKGSKWDCYASDNCATYILTSSLAHDKYLSYVHKYGRTPRSRWYRKNFNFERVQD